MTPSAVNRGKPVGSTTTDSGLTAAAYSRKDRTAACFDLVNAPRFVSIRPIPVKTNDIATPPADAVKGGLRA